VKSAPDPHANFTRAQMSSPQAEELTTGDSQTSTRRDVVYWWLAILLAGSYLATSFWISAHRLLWYDEIFTALTTRLPDLRKVWQVLASGGEQVPVLYFIVTRAFDQLVGHSDTALRAPSALAMACALLIVFDIARRLCNGIHGLLAMAIVSASFVPYYGFEARPYALFVMVAAGSLWIWTFTAPEGRASAWSFGVLFLTGVLLHPFFVFCAVPFGLAAAAELQWAHPKIVAAAIGIVGGLAGQLPQMEASHAALGNNLSAWAPPSIPALYGIYVDFFPLVTIPLALAAIVGSIVAGTRTHTVAPPGKGERIAWLFAAIPLAGFVAALLVTHFFFHRYFIGTVVGISVGAACWTFRQWGSSPRVAAALVLLFAGSGARQQWIRVTSADRIQPNSKLGPEGQAPFGEHQQRTKQLLAWEDTLRQDGKSKIAVCNASLYLESWYYSKHRGSYQIVQLNPPWTFARFHGLQFPTVKELISNARQTALVEPWPALLRDLEAAGLRTRIRFAYPVYVVYLE